MDDTTASATLGALVVKQGVALGGLKPDERALALGLAWARLPERELSEREINQVLKDALAGPAACLDTDHVELRRWLVDTGYVQRDGFGRAYRKVDAAALPPGVLPAGAVLQGLDVAAFVAARRAEQALARRARRAAWQAGGAGTRP